LTKPGEGPGEGKDRLRRPECPAVRSGETVMAKPGQQTRKRQSLGQGFFELLPELLGLFPEAS
jgi:hypothetical protein